MQTTYIGYRGVARNLLRGRDKNEGFWGPSESRDGVDRTIDWTMWYIATSPHKSALFRVHFCYNRDVTWRFVVCTEATLSTRLPFRWRRSTYTSRSRCEFGRPYFQVCRSFILSNKLSNVGFRKRNYGPCLNRLSCVVCDDFMCMSTRQTIHAVRLAQQLHAFGCKQHVVGSTHTAGHILDLVFSSLRMQVAYRRLWRVCRRHDIGSRAREIHACTAAQYVDRMARRRLSSVQGRVRRWFHRVKTVSWFEWAGGLVRRWPGSTLRPTDDAAAWQTLSVGYEFVVGVSRRRRGFDADVLQVRTTTHQSRRKTFQAHIFWWWQTRLIWTDESVDCAVQGEV